MPTIINPIITNAGLAAARSQSGLGLQLAITHVQLGFGGYTLNTAEGSADYDRSGLVTVTETVPVSAGHVTGSGFRVDVLFPSWVANAYGASEIGFWAGDPANGGVLFAYWAQPDAFVQRNNLEYLASFSVGLARVPDGSVTVTFDSSLQQAQALITYHEQATDPHQQYVLQAGDVMTGPLSVPAGAAGTQVPQVQEVIKKAGDAMTGALQVPAGATGAQVPQAQEVVKKGGDTMNGALGILPGTAGSPGLNVSGDTNTGLFSPGADILAAAAGGTELLRMQNGNLLVGITSANRHQLVKQAASQGVDVFSAGDQNNPSFIAYSAGGNFGSSTLGALSVATNSSNGRSIVAGGTVNASGADYAEYEFKESTCGDIAKGQIIGFTAQGKLTDIFAEAVRFGVKSTDPSYVGGDVWSTPEALGLPFPQEPTAPSEPHQPAKPDEAAPQSVQDAYAAAYTQYERDLAAYTQALQTYQTLHDTYVQDMDKFAAAIEAARVHVDRVAYAGKVPVNVLGAQPGDWIVPVANASGGIDGVAVVDADISFAQYRICVGRVGAILADGRAQIVVKAA